MIKDGSGMSRVVLLSHGSDTLMDSVTLPSLANHDVVCGRSMQNHAKEKSKKQSRRER